MKYLILFLFILANYVPAFPQGAVNFKIENFINKEYAALEELYKELHQNPELSLQEAKTAKVMATELKRVGFEVTENVGGHGVVGVLKNGKGPTILIRADMDALPLEEKTGLSYASKAKGVNAAGNQVSIMHACGHDIHMTVFIGTAKSLVQVKNQWKGTLV
ncbi:MAG: M20/M25/M40 family metallo-hydrolase, partial [Bacteroidota bacterium]|nr:M20/M25/M40 family metallo-hydrolase [Bacteroidota bacterium]